MVAGRHGGHAGARRWRAHRLTASIRIRSFPSLRFSFPRAINFCTITIVALRHNSYRSIEHSEARLAHHGKEEYVSSKLLLLMRGESVRGYVHYTCRGQEPNIEQNHNDEVLPL